MSCCRLALQILLYASFGPKQPRHAPCSEPQKHIAGWVGLKTLVAGLTKSKGGSQSEIPSHVDDARCFSIVFKNKTAIHLEVPAMGNGRSRAEWLDAFRELCDGSYKALLHPEDFDDS